MIQTKKYGLGGPDHPIFDFFLYICQKLQDCSEIWHGGT